LERPLDVEGRVASLWVVETLGKLLGGVGFEKRIVEGIELGIVERIGLRVVERIGLRVVDRRGEGLGSRLCMGAPALLSGRPRGPKKAV
jgi:hypothetical protein